MTPRRQNIFPDVGGQYATAAAIVMSREPLTEVAAVG